MLKIVYSISYILVKVYNLTFLKTSGGYKFLLCTV